MWKIAWIRVSSTKMTDPVVVGRIEKGCYTEQCQTSWQDGRTKEGDIERRTGKQGHRGVTHHEVGGNHAEHVSANHVTIFHSLFLLFQPKAAQFCLVVEASGTQMPFPLSTFGGWCWVSVLPPQVSLLCMCFNGQIKLCAISNLLPKKQGDAINPSIVPESRELLHYNVNDYQKYPYWSTTSFFTFCFETII